MIVIYKHINWTFDLFDNESNKFITEDEYDEIWETPDFFILERDNKTIVKTRSGSTIFDDEIVFVFHTDNSEIKSLIYTKSDGYGIISPNKKVLKPIFDSVTPTKWKLSNGSESFIVKLLDGRYTIWNSDKGLFSTTYISIKEIENGYLIIRNKREVGIKHLEFELELPLASQSINYINDCNRFLIHNDIGYKLLDEQLSCIIPEYNKLIFIGKDYFIKQNELNCSIVDLNGKTLPDLDLLDNDDWVLNLDFVYPNLPYFKKEGIFGFLNLDTMDFKFGVSKREIHFFSGSAVVCNNEDLYGLIDSNGNYLIESKLKKLTYCLDFFNYDYPILNNIGFPYIAQNATSEKYCLISFNGDFLTDFIYDSISVNENYSMSNNLYFFLKFKKGDKMGIMDIFGKEYFSDYFEYIDNENYEQEEDFLFQNADDFEINQQNYQFYTLKENHIHTIEDLPKKNVVFYAKKGDQIGYINLKGEFI